MEKKKKYILYLLVFLIPIISFLIHMFLGGCWPFGDNSILIGDAKDQYVFFYTELYDRIKNKQSLLFSWNGGMGYDFYSNIMYYLISPFSIIVLCFGNYSIELGMIIAIAVEIGCCAVAALYYFRHTYINIREHGRLNDIVTVFFAICYAMSNYILAYQYNMMWLPSLMLAPILMLGIERFVRKNDIRLYIITMFFIFVFNFYFAWFLCILSVLWFLDQNRGSLKEQIKRFCNWAIASICSAVAAAVILLPCYLALMGRNDENSDINTINIFSFANIGNFFQSFFWGSKLNTSGAELYTFNLYCGISIIFLFIGYILNTKISRKKRIKRFFIILFLIISLCQAGIIYVMHGFIYPRGFSNRHAFVLIIFILVSALESSCHLYRMEIWKVILGITCGLSAVIIAFSINENLQSIACYMATILIIVYLILCMGLYIKKSITSKGFLINILIIGFLEVFSNSVVINGKKVIQIDTQYASASSEWNNNYNNILLSNGERKTSWIYSRNNQIYSDTNLFSSMKNANIGPLFKNIGLTYQDNGNTYIYRGTTPITASMFNVRNVLTDVKAHYGGFLPVKEMKFYNDYEKQEHTIWLEQNEYQTSLGFLLPDEIMDWAYSAGNVFEVQNDFVKKVLNKENNVFIPVNISNFEVSGNYCLPLENKGASFPYICTVLNDELMGLEVDFEVPKNMHLYTYISDKYSIITNVYIDGKEYSPMDYYDGNRNLLDLGEVKKGQKISIAVYNHSSIGTNGCTDMLFYEIDEDVVKEYQNRITRDPFNITKFEDTCIEGNITASEDGIMYTSIPYYKGFKVYVDGKQTEITKIGDALIGVKLQKGEHDIRITYFPYGLKLGIALSIFGIAGMIVICKKNKKYIIK